MTPRCNSIFWVPIIKYEAVIWDIPWIVGAKSAIFRGERLQWRLQPVKWVH